MKMLYARQTAGWKSKITESKLWRNAAPSSLQLNVIMLKLTKIWCTYTVIYCVKSTNFWIYIILMTSIKNVQTSIIMEFYLRKTIDYGF